MKGPGEESAKIMSSSRQKCFARHLSSLSLPGCMPGPRAKDLVGGPRRVVSVCLRFAKVSMVGHASGGRTLILEETPNLVLRQRKYSKNLLICWFIKRANCASEHIGPQRGLYIYPHINWSLLYLLHGSRRFASSSKIKISP